MSKQFVDDLVKNCPDILLNLGNNIKIHNCLKIPVQYIMAWTQKSIMQNSLLLSLLPHLI